MASLGAVKPLRSTGHFERYNIARNYVGYYTNVGATATYSVTSRLFGQEVSESGFESIILTALEKTVYRHPALCIGIKGEETLTPEWIRLGDNKSKVKWCEVVKFLESDRGDEWLEDEHSHPFERVTQLPLWRVSVTKRSAEEGDGKIRFKVGFYFHHAIGDGISGGAFHIAFRDALNQISEGKLQINISMTMEDEITFPPNIELLPNLERANPLPITFLFMLRMLIDNFLYKKEDLSLWKGSPIPKTASGLPVTRVKSFSLDKDTTARLVARCREQKTTLTSLMSYLVAKKLATIHPDYTRFTGLIPFSFRRFTNTSNNEITLQVSTNPIRFTNNPQDKDKRFIYTNTNPTEEINWLAIRAIKKSIDVEIKPSNQLIGMLKWVGDVQKYFRGKLGTPRDASFEMSNIGVVDGGIGEGDHVCFEKLVFSACIAKVATAYSFCVASVKGGDLTVVLQWEDGVLAREEAEDVVRTLDGEMRGLVGKKEM